MVILKELDRSDFWDAWREADPVANPSGFAELQNKRVGLFVCPSDDPDRNRPIELRGELRTAGRRNWGNQASGIPPDWPANGVFHRRYSDSKPNDFIRVSISMSDIKDGAQHTLLLSENVQAGEWSTLNPVEQGLGMVWWPNYDASNTSAYGSVPINAERDEVTGSSIKTARPSSFHPGGVIATFCDGHTQFVSEDIDYLVYQLLMTPDGANAKIAGDNSVPAGPPKWRTTPLDESMLQ